MSTHAKEPESTPGQAIRLGRTLRGAFARGTHSQRDAGSGAPSHRRGRLALLSLVSFAFVGLVLVVASAFASKEVIRYVGSAGSGSVGGEFSSPRDTAVNSTGEGGVPAGTFYVVDGNNNRIQRFSPSATSSAHGAQTSSERSSNERYRRLTVEATAGSYSLEFEGAKPTVEIAYNASFHNRAKRPSRSPRHRRQLQHPTSAAPRPTKSNDLSGQVRGDQRRPDQRPTTRN